MIKIVPFCKKQLLDIRPEDIVSPYIRKCDISRAMNGVDKFTDAYEKRFGIRPHNVHYIAQTYGCSRSCGYCYVTHEGIWGSPNTYIKHVIAYHIFKDLRPSAPENTVYHLMGGAPAFWINDWLDVWYGLPDTGIFHSDFLLNEMLYEAHERTFDQLKKHDRQLHAVGLKEQRSWSKLELVNLEFLQRSGLPFYLTFTGCIDHQRVAKALLAPYVNHDLLEEMYNIPIFTGFKALQD